MPGGSVWEVVGGKDSGGITVRTGKDLKSPESPGGRLAHRALIAELELEGERLRFTRLSGEGPNEGWVSLSFKNNTLVKRSGEKGTKAAKDAKQLEELKANGGIMEPKPGCYRVLLLAQGSRGDVQPVLALAIACRKAGWSVHFMAPPENKEFVTSYGFRFTGCGIDLRDLVAENAAGFDPEDPKAKAFQDDPGKAGGEMLGDHFNKEASDKLTEVVMEELKKAKEEEALPDAIFFHPLGGFGVIQAWKNFNIPIFCLDYVTSAISDQEDVLEEHFATPMMQDLDQEQIAKYGADPFEGFTAMDVAKWKKACTITCTSALSLYSFDWFLEMPDEMKQACKSGFCGPMIIEPEEQMVDLSYFGGQETLRRIQDFLDAGERPIYAGWGSMPMVYPTLMKVITAIKFIKKRVIILGGWAKFNLEDFCAEVSKLMPEDPFGLVEYAKTEALFVAVAPHEWLFQRCAATIHHGGAGTTQAALRSGNPTIITPFSFDQFQYAQLVINLGCGQTLSLQEGGDKMMDPQWTKAFRKAAQDKAMIEKAKEVAVEIRKEVGTTNVMARLKEGIERHRSGEAEGLFGR